MTSTDENKKYLLTGNEACAEAAIQAGCRFYYGYPITPQNEILTHMAIRMPQVGGTSIQVEQWYIHPWNAHVCLWRKGLISPS